MALPSGGDCGNRIGLHWCPQRYSLPSSVAMVVDEMQGGNFYAYKTMTEARPDIGSYRSFYNTDIYIHHLAGGRRIRPASTRRHQRCWRHNREGNPVNKTPQTVSTDRATSGDGLRPTFRRFSDTFKQNIDSLSPAHYLLAATRQNAMRLREASVAAQ